MSDERKVKVNKFKKKKYLFSSFSQFEGKTKKTNEDKSKQKEKLKKIELTKVCKKRAKINIFSVKINESVVEKSLCSFYFFLFFSLSFLKKEKTFCFDPNNLGPVSPLSQKLLNTLSIELFFFFVRKRREEMSYKREREREKRENKPRSSGFVRMPEAALISKSVCFVRFRKRKEKKKKKKNLKILQLNKELLSRIFNLC